MTMVVAFTLFVATVISLAVVFAATLADVNTNIKIKYNLYGVGVRISANYAVVDTSSTEIPSITAIKTEDDKTELEINVVDSVDLSQVAMQNVSATLNATKNKVVYEYIFTNISDAAFVIDLSNASSISSTNMNIRYFVSKDRLAQKTFITNFALDAALTPQAVVEPDKTVYIYISAEIIDTSASATFSGEFIWDLTAAKESELRTIALNNGTASGGQETLTIISGDCAMPFVYELPTPEAGKAFIGYFTEANGGGTKYINSRGASAHLADLADGATLYAHFEDAFVIEDGVITGLTASGAAATELILPTTATQIGNSAFKANNSLQRVVIPDCYTDIGVSAFENCYNLKEVVIGDETITYADGTSNLKTIQAKAFSACNSLEKINLPEGLELIGTNAFYRNYSLPNITFPSTLKTIQSGAFYRNKFTSIYIPASVTSIGGSAFNFSKTLQTITVDSANPNYTSGEANGGRNVLVEKSTGILMQGSHQAVIPNNVTKIANYAFSYMNELTSVTLPDTLESIGLMSFFWCKGLTQITIPADCNYIGKYAFRTCTSLSKITFISQDGWYYASSSTATSGTNIDVSNASTNATNLKKVDVGWNPYYLQRSVSPFVFGTYEYEDENLNLTTVKSITGLTAAGQSATELVIPNDVVVIESNAFLDTTNLVTLTYEANSSLKLIGDNAFNGSSIEELRLPSTVTQVGLGMVYACGQLKTLELPYVMDSMDYIYDGPWSGTVTTLIINGGAISANGLSGYTSLTSITLNNVSTIRSSAFSGCTGITKVNTNSLEGWCNIAFADSDANPIKITGSLYLNNSKLTTLTIPSTVTKIKDYAFYNLDSITQLNLHSNITTIGVESFSNCGGLTSLTIPEGVTTLSEGCFKSLTSLTTLTVPTTITQLGYRPFTHCSKLTTLYWNVIRINNTLVGNDSPFYYAGQLGSGITVYIGDEVEEIPAYVWYFGLADYRPKIEWFYVPEYSNWSWSTNKGATSGTKIRFYNSPLDEIPKAAAADNADEYMANHMGRYVFRIDSTTHYVHSSEE